MPELDIRVTEIEAAKHAAVPSLAFMLEIRDSEDPPAAIQSIALQCQIRIEPQRRAHAPHEKQRLVELFGGPESWNRSLQSLLWTHTQVRVPAFERRCLVDMTVPCSFDFNVAATKYFDGLAEGAVPLLLLWSGSVFYRDAEGALAIEFVSWNRESRCALPIETWRRMMDAYYPGQSWLCLDRRVFEALYEYKRRHGYTGFDEALASLLPDAKRRAS